MVAEKYAVRLSSEDRDQLERLIRSGQRSARVINRARILLKTDEGWSASRLAAAPVSSTGQAMEDVLDLYAEPYDTQRPVVCFDETSTQLLADVREPLPPQPGRPRRHDYEYRRAGTRNIFLACEPLAGWRHVAITERRTMLDFAYQMRWLVDVAYPDAPVVRVVLDNPVSSTGQALNTHRMASLYETFPAAEARRIAKRLEFHHTPKHASWLNMAEIEFSALSRSCLKRRNPDADALQRQITAYETQRNSAGVTINWRFSTHDARTKLHRFYPCLSNVDGLLDYDQVASAGAMNSVNRNMRVQGHQSRIMSNRQGQEINVSQLPVASQPPRVQSCIVQQADIFANEAMVFG